MGSLRFVTDLSHPAAPWSWVRFILYQKWEEASWNVMAHAHKPDFLFRRNENVHLNRRGRHFRRLLAAEVCASSVVLLDKPCSELVWRVLATHSIHQFPLLSPPPARTSPCAIIFQLEFTRNVSWVGVKAAGA